MDSYIEFSNEENYTSDCQIFRYYFDFGRTLQTICIQSLL